MEKKPNGYPAATDRGQFPCNPPTRPGFDGVNPPADPSDNADMGCGGGGCLDDMPLAYVYAPSQKFRLLYSASDALRHGTLFEELYKPREVYGNE